MATRDRYGAPRSSRAANGQVVVATDVIPPLRRGRRRGRRPGRGQHRLRARPLHRDHGPLGLGQVDPDAHPRRARQADLGHGRRSTASEITGLDDGELTKLRRDKLGFVFQFFNLLPVLTAEENLVLPLSIAGRKPDQRVARPADPHGRPRGPPHPPALRALRRPAAARRRRPRAGLQTGRRLRRRADRQPRLEGERRRAAPAAPGGRRVRPDGDHGHPRSRPPPPTPTA